MIALWKLAAKNGEPFCFRAQCALSSASPSTSTAVLNLEKLRLPSLESHSDSIAANRPWTYIGGIGPPKEVRLALFGISLQLRSTKLVASSLDTLFVILPIKPQSKKFLPFIQGLSNQIFSFY